jgi:hypothetical protein
VKRTTIFGFRWGATKAFRVVTQSSVYILSIHEDGQRRYAFIRGEAGTDREHVMGRDSDPRVGEYSLFDLEPQEWVGKCLEIAAMTTSEVQEVEPHRLSPEQLRLARLTVVPKGVQEHPQTGPQIARGTTAGAPVPRIAREASQAARSLEISPPSAPARPPETLGEPPPDPRLQYPLNQVLSVEYAAIALRSLLPYQHLEKDLDHDQLRRLQAALYDCVEVAKYLKARYPR